MSMLGQGQGGIPPITTPLRANPPVLNGLDAAASDSEQIVLQELRELERSKRIDWTLPMQESLARAGLDLGRFELEQWSRLKWYAFIEQWLHHPEDNITDILINDPGTEVFIIERGATKGTGVYAHKTWVEFLQHQFLMRSGAVAPHLINAWPRHLMVGTVDGRLRYACTRTPATPKGPSISIRVLPRRWRLMDDLVREGVVDADCALIMVEAVRNGCNVLIAGSTGAGKTTLTAGLLQTMGSEKRVVVVEEACELPFLHNSVHMEVLHSGLTFSECVYFTLRQKPDLVVVGEVRGPEGLAMIKAAATGHPGICTIHAPDAQTALRNLERMACEIGEVNSSIIRGMVSTLPLIVAHIGFYDGRRYVGNLMEVIGVGGGGQSGDKYPLNPLFRYNERTRSVERASPVYGEWGRGRF